MDIFTHLILGILTYFPLILRLSPEAILLIALIISVLRKTFFFEIWIAGFIGYSLHVSLDFFTASKIPIFYPISKKEFRIIADRAINPVLFIFSGLNFIILISFLHINPDYHFFRTLTMIYSYIYLGYFGARAILRIAVQIQLSKNEQYIPGIIPFSYFIYMKNINNGDMAFKLIKKFAFSRKSEEIINHSILKDSHFVPYFEIAEKVSQEFRFFHKWNSIIPFFNEKNNLINIVLILAESYSRESSYFLSIILDKNSKQVISKEEGFGSFKKWKNF